jgi:tRNA threonylcarbamoyladenosine biosynthesis protein TsaE
MAILSNKAIDFTSNSVEQTERLGIRLGELLQLEDIVCLAGDLGAGKTVIARGIGRGWGTTARVTSPTFTLINEYPRAYDGSMLYHIDCYRLQGMADIITTGIEDILDSSGALMIEWPEIIETYLPEDRLTITLRYVSETRRGLRITAGHGRSLELLTEFRRSAFGR